MEELRCRCHMCLRKFTVPRPHPGKAPAYCPECLARRKTEQSRLAMARRRARLKQAAAASAH